MLTIIFSVCVAVLTISLIIMIVLDSKQSSKKAQETTKNSGELLTNIRFFRTRISQVKSLQELMTVHIQMWAAGIQNKNLGPNKYGMFRTTDILRMTPEEVFLGDVYGLHTKPLPFWEKAPKEERDMVLIQYQTLLASNLETIAQK